MHHSYIYNTIYTYIHIIIWKIYALFTGNNLKKLFDYHQYIRGAPVQISKNRNIHLTVINN